jgi:hypothetical protein
MARPLRDVRLRHLYIRRVLRRAIGEEVRRWGGGSYLWPSHHVIAARKPGAGQDSGARVASGRDALQSP